MPNGNEIGEEAEERGNPGEEEEGGDTRGEDGDELADTIEEKMIDEQKRKE
ncbi:UNVERIFIED_CONTAM: hypothetical protein HHA_452050 [Hammondia hammondi]|eukprot:XP_008885039.1 hypothetical protein HHA_452050 [Hammondia hammondi]